MQHQKAVYSPSGEGCAHCNNPLSRDWGWVDVPCKLSFFPASKFSGYMSNYVFKQDVKGLRYYYDTIVGTVPFITKYYGRGMDHNKCREPFARALRMYDENCHNMTLGQIAHWATEHRIIKQTVVNKKRPRPNDSIFDCISNISTELDYLSLHIMATRVSEATGIKIPNTGEDIAAFITAYYNLARFKLTPVPAPKSIKYVSAPEFNAAQSLLTFDTSP